MGDKVKTEKKRAKSAPMDKQALFGLVCETTTTGIVFADLKGRVLFSNPAARAMIDSLADGKFRLFSKKGLLPPEPFAEMLAGARKQFDLENFQHPAFGSARIQVFISLLRNEEDEPMCFSARFRDVTEPWMEQQASRESAENYRNLVEFAKDGICILQDERVKYVNRHLAELLGEEPGDVMGEAFLPYVTPKDRPQVMKSYARHMRGEDEPFLYEVELIAKDGRIIPVEINSGRIAFEGRPAGFVFVRDITERRRADEALQTELRKFQALYDLAVTMSTEHTLDENLSFVVEKCRELLNADTAYIAIRDESRGDVYMHTLTGIRTEAFKQLRLPIGEGLGGLVAETRRGYIIEDYFAARKITHAVDRVVADEGVVSGMAVPVQMGARNLGVLYVFNRTRMTYSRPDLEILSLIGNIAALEVARREAIGEKESLQQQLMQSQKMEAIGTLAGGIAHEFNNMLAVIMGSAELTLKKTAPDDPNQGRLQRIRKTTQRARDLTKKLLTFARKEKLNVRPTGLNTIIADTLDMIEKTIPRNIRVEQRLNENIPNVLVDANQIVQSLLNICLNAADAMPQGGALRIETLKPKTADIPKHLANPENRWGLIRISDTGAGIAPAQLARIFDPFFTTKEKGTGLGLSITLGIIRNHGGNVAVRSEPGRGTTVDILLPATDAAEMFSRSAAETVVGNHETVLIVDDDMAFLETTVESLAASGFHPIPASSGREALEIVRSQNGRIDAALLDMIMPDMNGREVFAALREAAPHIPIILCSGYSVDGQTDDLPERGLNGFIQKPFDLNVLCEKLLEVLPKKTGGK